MQVLIWSFEHNGWWAPSRMGYVPSADGAGLYELDEAIEICRQANIADCNEAIVIPYETDRVRRRWLRPKGVPLGRR